jgi:hypothetical protein
MNNSQKPINPIFNEYGWPRKSDDLNPKADGLIGLTKREYFAGLAMQGIMSNSHWLKIQEGMSTEGLEEMNAAIAVQAADRLLKQLEK